MRAFMATLVLLALLAGCTAPAPPATQAPPEEPVQPAPPEKPAQQPAFCEAEAGCKFWDEDFHEFVLYRVDTYHVDVLVVPSASPGALDDTEAIRQSIDAWEAGILAQAEPWFGANFTIETYVLGQDVPPQSAIDDPEIIVVAAEYNPVLLFGIGYQAPETPCRDGEALHTYEPHSHHGMQVLAAECRSGGLVCVALNTNFLLGGSHRLYDLVAHEFGHCLGIGHVGDALDFSAKRVPIQDIMSYQHDESQVHCVSNLNVRVLEGVYASLLGQPESIHLAPGEYYKMPQADYGHVECANP